MLVVPLPQEEVSTAQAVSISRLVLCDLPAPADNPRGRRSSADAGYQRNGLHGGPAAVHSGCVFQSPPGRLHSVHDRASAARGCCVFLASGGCPVRPKTLPGGCCTAQWIPAVHQAAGHRGEARGAARRPCTRESG